MADADETVSNPPAPTPSAAAWRWRRFLIPGLVCLLGTVLVVCAFKLVRHYEAKWEVEDFRALARGPAQELKRQAEDAVEVLLSLGQFFAASKQVEAADFRAFTAAALDDHPEIYSIAWLPRVPFVAREAFERAQRLAIYDQLPDGRTGPVQPRSEYFPVAYIEPFAPTRQSLGLDFASMTTCAEAMNRARDEGAPVGTTTRQRLQLPDQDLVSPASLVFLPIYPPAPALTTVEERRTRLLGFAAISLDVERLFDLVVPQSQGARSIDLQLLVAGPGESPHLFYTLSPDTQPWTNNVPMQDVLRFNLAGCQWTVVSRPTDLYPTHDDWESWGVLMGGLFLTALLASYISSMIGRTAKVERMVTTRTRQLAEMNQQLQSEITERKRTEEAITHSEALFHSLVDSLPLNVVRKDLQGHVTFGNGLFCQTMGRSLPELLGKTDFDLFPRPLAEKYVTDDQVVLTTGQVFEDVEAHRTPEGEELYMHVLKSPVRDAHERIVGLQVMFWDVTARKRAEKALESTAAELSRSNRELELFAYVASHDLQEPLRMIASYTQLLARRYKDKLDDEAGEYIKFAVDGAVRMQQLINDLLAYSRVGTKGKAFAPTDCEKVFETILTNLKIAREESGAIITHDPLPTLDADSVQLTQLWQNLLSNAMKFRGQTAPVIHAGCEPLETEWKFSVRDNGIGIAPQYFDRIFVIFQRLHTQQEYSGTGIGLALCKRIVERHGGKIWVESTAGQGTTFFFTLPKRPGTA